MKMSWMKQKSNPELLYIIVEPRQVIKMTETKRTQFIGHNLKYNKFILNVTEKK